MAQRDSNLRSRQRGCCNHQKKPVGSKEEQAVPLQGLGGSKVENGTPLSAKQERQIKMVLHALYGDGMDELKGNLLHKIRLANKNGFNGQEIPIYYGTTREKCVRIKAVVQNAGNVFQHLDHKIELGISEKFAYTSLVFIVRNRKFREETFTRASVSEVKEIKDNKILSIDEKFSEIDPALDKQVDKCVSSQFEKRCLREFVWDTVKDARKGELGKLFLLSFNRDKKLRELGELTGKVIVQKIETLQREERPGKLTDASYFEKYLKNLRIEVEKLSIKGMPPIEQDNRSAERQLCQVEGQERNVLAEWSFNLSVNQRFVSRARRANKINIDLKTSLLIAGTRFDKVEEIHTWLSENAELDLRVSGKGSNPYVIAVVLGENKRGTSHKDNLKVVLEGLERLYQNGSRADPTPSHAVRIHRGLKDRLLAYTLQKYVVEEVYPSDTIALFKSWREICVKRVNDKHMATFGGADNLAAFALLSLGKVPADKDAGSAINSRLDVIYKVFTELLVEGLKEERASVIALRLFTDESGEAESWQVRMGETLVLEADQKIDEETPAKLASMK